MFKKLFLMLAVFLFVGMLFGTAMACNICDKGSAIGPVLEQADGVMVLGVHGADALGTKPINEGNKVSLLGEPLTGLSFDKCAGLVAMGTSIPPSGVVYLPDINNNAKQDNKNHIGTA